MKQNSFDKFSNSYNAIREFWQDNNLQPQNNCIRFNGYVSYSSKLHSPSGEAEIRIELSGYNTEGKIVINGDDFDINNVHIEFLPQFQDYTYDKNQKSLSIIGNSPKMFGDYKVIIIL